MQSRKSRLWLVVAVTFSIGCVLAVYVYDLRQRERPFASSSELADTILSLPDVERGGESARHALNPYVRVAIRMKATDRQVVRAALIQLRNDPPSDPIEIKLMILIRICFICPSGTLPIGQHGGWIPAKQSATNSNVYDINWPVERRFGHFYLRDDIVGYTGTGYDPVKEFDWMATNCQWRSL